MAEQKQKYEESKVPMSIKQSELNIGTLGHIDHGKTSLTRAITGVWTDKHSESLKRNMTIKLGYADAVIRKCEHCEGASAFTTTNKCIGCEGEAKPVMRISILDAPGHETLMATAIAGSSVIDAILFVIAANEPCPMQQTREHLMIINILGIKNIIVVQTKVDIVGRDKAVQHYNQIREFLKGSAIENAPIVPVMSNLGVNIDVLLEMITKMEKPKRDTEADPIMYVVRSFVVNKPGADVTKMNGGVIGGAIVSGKFRLGEEIEIRPGMKSSNAKGNTYKPILTKILSISTDSTNLDEAVPGGLIAFGTALDPSITKADSLVGSLVGRKGKLPESKNEITLKYTDLKRTDMPKRAFSLGEPLILGIGTATRIGHIKKVRKNDIDVELNHPVCATAETKVAVMRNDTKRWRLTGYGFIE